MFARTANVCKCDNGSPKSGAHCTTNGAAMCQSCKAGWTINGAETACLGSYTHTYTHTYIHLGLGLGLDHVLIAGL